jgi:tRNA dimethylallyltransferase
VNSKNLYLYNSIVLAGPTATGKTALAIKLAKKFNGEVITVDSAQVYKGMDIGTAKPSLAEMDGVLHHLIDVHDVDKPFNVATFVEHVDQVLKDIFSRGKIPIFAGGTGMYFQAIIEGLPITPPANLSVRARLELLSTEELWELLCKKDPAYAETITFNDRHKILRANEILITTQQKISTQKARYKTQECAKLSCKAYFIYRPRPILYQRLNDRAKFMCENGLLQEVESLICKGIELNHSAKKAIAYQQPLRYLKGEISYEKMLEELQQANRNYAKRQFTWFKRFDYYEPVDLELISDDQFLSKVHEDLFKADH